jgi:hypothetical protein
MGYFVDYIKARNSENLFSGTATEQVSTLMGVTKKGVDENIGVYENGCWLEDFRSTPPA